MFSVAIFDNNSCEKYTKIRINFLHLKYSDFYFFETILKQNPKNRSQNAVLIDILHLVTQTPYFYNKHFAEQK